MPPQPSETDTIDFTVIKVNVGGKDIEVEWPSAPAKALGVVSCANGHPNIANSAGEISCGCGSTEVIP